MKENRSHKSPRGIPVKAQDIRETSLAGFE
jgi:hypothetical protein